MDIGYKRFCILLSLGGLAIKSLPFKEGMNFLKKEIISSVLRGNLETLANWEFVGLLRENLDEEVSLREGE